MTDENHNQKIMDPRAKRDFGHLFDYTPKKRKLPNEFKWAYYTESEKDKSTKVKEIKRRLNSIEDMLLMLYPQDGTRNIMAKARIIRNELNQNDQNNQNPHFIKLRGEYFADTQSINEIENYIEEIFDKTEEREEDVVIQNLIVNTIPVAPAKKKQPLYGSKEAYQKNREEMSLILGRKPKRESQEKETNTPTTQKDSPYKHKVIMYKNTYILIKEIAKGYNKEYMHRIQAEMRKYFNENIQNILLPIRREKMFFLYDADAHEDVKKYIKEIWPEMIGRIEDHQNNTWNKYAPITDISRLLNVENTQMTMMMEKLGRIQEGGFLQRTGKSGEKTYYVPMIIARLKEKELLRSIGLSRSKGYKINKKELEVLLNS